MTVEEQMDAISVALEDEQAAHQDTLRLLAAKDREIAALRRAAAEYLQAVSMTSNGLSTDRSHYDRIDKAETALRAALSASPAPAPEYFAPLALAVQERARKRREPAPDPAEYVMDKSVTTPYPYQELKYSSGGISTPAPDPAEAMRDEIAELKEELDQWREVFVDERGEVWRRPTAWAYAQACRVRHELEAELAALKGNGEGR